MLRKILITLAATTFMGAMAASTTADARSGGPGGGGMRMGGGGMHMGGGGGMRGFSGGGMRGGGMHMGGGGFRSGGFAGPRNFAVNRGFVGHRNFVSSHRFVGSRHFAGHRFARFHHRRSFAAVPFFVGGAFASSYYYDDPCWVVQYTQWGPTYVNTCGYDDYWW